MKCVSCQAKKGKRGCKIAAGQMICPACCASTRGSNCEGCGHYQSSLSYQWEKDLTGSHARPVSVPEVEAGCDKAFSLMEKEQPEQSKTILEGLDNRHPDHYLVLYGLGLCHGMAAENDKAIASLEKSIKAYSYFPDAHLILGIAYLKKMEVEKGLSSFQAAALIDGEDGKVGRAARQRLAAFADLLARSGLDMQTYLGNNKIFLRGFEALHAKRFQEAVELFSQVLATDKGHVQSYGNLGLAYAGLGNNEKALEHLDKALTLEPGYEPAIVNKASVLRLKDGEPLVIEEIRDVNYYGSGRVIAVTDGK